MMGRTNGEVIPKGGAMADIDEKEWHLRRLGSALYFFLQAGSTGLWWLWLVFAPEVRPYFYTRRMGETAFLDLAWADVPVVVVGSFLVGIAIMRDAKAPWTQRGVWLCFGGLLYVTLIVLGSMVASGGEGWVAGLLMSGALAGTFLAAWTIRPESSLFQEAPPRSPSHHIARTMFQTSFFWFLSLMFLPWFLRKIEVALGLAPFQTPAQTWLPCVFFGLVAPFNLGSGWTMARWGEGTPLPLETARLLVVRGPYRVIRNPMAASGLFLGLMIGWWLGSWLTVGAVFVGGLFWNFFVRPIEEADLRKRFGEAYLAYCKAVPCWRVRWPPAPPSPPL